ncbi:MAG: PAS domain-containing protein [Flavobacteriales bacterium]|nr:PAS domain-containing protein [Flavobacteriales bacterium]
MNKKGPHHPDVASLFRTLEELRSETPQANKDLPARLEKLLGQFPHFAGHFLYVFNYSLGRVVYARGFKEVLGYIDAKVDTGLLYGIVHPDDAPAVSRLTQSAIKAMIGFRDPGKLPELCLTLDYRMRKADGHYIKVLRQSAVFEVDEASGVVHSTFSLLKDISGIKSSNRIGWQANGFDFLDIQLPQSAAERVEYRPTPRELDVLRRMAVGKASKKIAAELCISPMTVITHRRNLLRRTGMKNAVELMRYASEMGWV